LNRTIDDHLGGVGIVELKARSVTVLTLGELRGGKTVMPSLTVPVINVFFKDDDVGGWNGLLTLELAEESVGRWAAGAALRGKEFDEDWLAGLG
jgi:hypothetical protein